MPIQSVGEAISTGIVQGAELGLQATNQRERSEDRKTLLAQREQERQDRITQQNEANVDKSLARDRLAQQDQRQAAQDARTQAKDELSVLDDEYKSFQTEAQSAIANFGGFSNVPPEYKQQMITRQKEIEGRRSEARKKFANPQIAADQKKAAEFFARVQAGQEDFDAASPHDTYKNLTYMLKRPVEDFIRTDPNKPSKIEQAALDVQAGMKAGNNDLLVQGANVLYAPELSRGVGELRSDGSRIVSKEISQLVPHPEDPTKFVPILKVTVERQDGARGVYEAPVTENRSSDPQDMPKVIDIDDALDDMGKKETLAATFNRPDQKKKLEEGAKTARPEVEEFLASMSAVGVTAPKKQITRTNTDLGNRVRTDEFDASGARINTTYENKGAPPKAVGIGGSGGGKVGGAKAQQIALIEEQLANGDITEDEAKAARLKAIGLTSKDQQAAGQKEASAAAGIAQAERLITTVDEAAKLVGMNTAGLGGAIMRRIPGTEAVDLSGALQTIKANLGFAELAAMRQASPTGGALGAIAVQELQALQSTVASLDEKQSPDKLKQSLEKIRGHYEKWKSTLEQSEAGAVSDRPDTPINKAAAASTERPAPTLPGIKGTSMTPPKEFRAKGRDAAADFQGALKALEMRPDAADEIRKRLIGAGYPAAAVNAAIK